ncbi:NUDIX domain-containing protein [Streptomyces sp. SID2999]|uniref:NUDIX domain-containing protein n=1 Tax=Streptomyces sp. SID2999 TaxID=2690258 RepID=UPI00136AF82C|nr:NUDIX domain-containing protein [Streptomyces sp. SID2999]MYZ10298.1 NUDIX domain-containing protein [Streptomyces sp. SID2999]
MLDQRFSVLVAAIAVRDDRVLLLQRSEREKFLPGAWGVPCGKIEFGEELEDAVLREMKEESGLSGTVRALVGSSRFMSKKDGISLHNIQLNYVVTDLAGSVQLDASSQDHRWLGFSELRAFGLEPFMIDTIEQGLPYLRSQGAAGGRG